MSTKLLILKNKEAYLFLILFFISFLFNGCQEKKRANTKLKIVCTTSMIADVFQQIAGDSAQVVALMGAGVDPHLYKATHGDIKKLLSADVVFYNGLHLEGKMGEIMQKLARQKPVVALGEGLDSARLIYPIEEAHTPDPHIWFDVLLWKEAVRYGAIALESIDKELFAGKRASYFRKNTENYLQKLDSLDKATRATLDHIPTSQRVLITSHDAFSYFGRAYQFEVRGLQGISTLSDFGLKDVSDLVNFIVKNKIKAIFVETSVSEQSIKAVIKGCQAQGHQVKMGGKLFSDALGKAGTFEGTYIGMIQSNAKTIANALR
jgi:manganese/zinc/iron transport system substrate-binding protein